MDTSPAPANSGPQHNRKDKGRRGWSTIEEKHLAEGMKKIIREGMKSENGFKTGYLAQLETYLKSKLESCTLKPDPHIISRITAWKRNYHSLFDILKVTWVGMDSSTHMIDATEEQWEGFMKADPHVRGMRQKLWPLYDDWCEIFGTTRATGEGAQDHKAAEKAPTEMNVNDDSNPINLDGGEDTQSQSCSAHMGESSAAGKSSGRRKMKVTHDPDPFIDVMSNLCETAAERLGEIAQRIGREQDLSISRKKIYECVQAMDCMTKMEKFCVTALIAQKPENIEVFFSLPENDRLEWALAVLHGEI